MLRKWKWWNAPEQSLLRYEADWFWRFLRSRRGVFLFIAQLLILVSINFVNFPYHMKMKPVMKMFPNFQLGFAVVSAPYRTFFTLLIMAPWLHLFNWRVLKRLQNPCRSELIMLPINGKMFWPALTLSPLLWIVVAQPLAGLIVFVGNGFATGWMFLGLRVSMPVDVMDKFIVLINDVVFLSAVNVIVIRLILKKASFGNSLLSCVILLLIIHFIGTFIYINLLAHQAHFGLLYYFLRRFCSIFFWCSLIIVLLHYLRSDRGWRAFVASSENARNV